MICVYQVSSQDWAVGTPGPSVNTPGAGSRLYLCCLCFLSFLSLLLEITGTLDWTVDNNVFFSCCYVIIWNYIRIQLEWCWRASADPVIPGLIQHIPALLVAASKPDSLHKSHNPPCADAKVIYPTFGSRASAVTVLKKEKRKKKKKRAVTIFV